MLSTVLPPLVFGVTKGGSFLYLHHEGVDFKI
jgi:hypothetical protein